MGLHDLTASNDRGLNSLKSLCCFYSYWNISTLLSCSPACKRGDTLYIHGIGRKQGLQFPKRFQFIASGSSLIQVLQSSNPIILFPQQSVHFSNTGVSL